ncbi:glycine-rich domain-containing protein [Oribacterium sp. HCP28S3_H8]|uniref:glycine-rich domain-containing protein n=1 Tax=Oribacterium sp. HCP28S3_H8 TaxID=3438945 RepID=UPI003F88E57F
MGVFRPKGGSGSSNVLCTAGAEEILSGYTGIGKDSPLPVSGTLAATGNAQAEHVVENETFYSGNFKIKQTGSLKRVAAIDSMNSAVLSDGKIYVRMTPGAHIDKASSGYPEISGSADAFISALGIATATNFNAAQYTSQRLQFTWAKPDRSQKMWSGIRITARQDRYPNGPDDSSYKWDSNSVYLITDVIPSGNWYITVWNYVTWDSNSRRTYGGIVRQFTFNNSVVSGSQNFTGSTTWRVPDAVRSIQVFLVGGGGGTPNLSSNGDNSQYGGGAGGGYTNSAYIDVTPGETLSINVGAGGGIGGDGSASSVYRGGTNLISADGGKAGADGARGGSGGSGGGAGGYSYGGPGGRNGGNGEPSKDSSSVGIGQGRSTHCPWDDIAYAGGGGGGSAKYNYGGDAWDGGGRGGDYESANSGTANTGGGAGGVGHNSNHSFASGKTGGSGIIRIRW